MNVMTRPRIALTAPKPTSEDPTYSRYVLALTRAGADVVEVLPHGDLPDDVDGLCLSGGPDVDPVRYGEPDAGVERDRVDPDRDAMEFRAAERALARDIPVLAVCRGFQLLNVVMGGKLVQDLPGHRATDHAVHEISASPGSKLAAACGPNMTVNSRHHQGITADGLSPDLRPTAFVERFVEAYEAPDHRWVVGVQWHPERVLADEEPVDTNAAKIFTAFVAEATRTPIRS